MQTRDKSGTVVQFIIDYISGWNNYEHENIHYLSNRSSLKKITRGSVFLKLRGIYPTSQPAAYFSNLLSIKITAFLSAYTNSIIKCYTFVIVHTNPSPVYPGTINSVQSLFQTLSLSPRLN